jgi:putative toxin-antitoxin system antitoxin component (TIGR02293 family)
MPNADIVPAFGTEVGMGRGVAALKQERASVADLARQFTHENIERGVAASIVGKIVAADVLSRSEIERLVPARTLARRIAARERLKSEEADAIGRVVRLTEYAQRMLGDRHFAHKWLRLPVPSLKNRIPIELARTDAGAREVEAALTRIAYGVYV